MQQASLPLAIVLGVCWSCGPRHTVPDSLIQLQLGDVCSVTMVTDITSSHPCDEVKSLLPPMGSCTLRQVLAAPSRDVLFDFLLGYQGQEETVDGIWRKFQELGGRTIHGPIVQSMATPKKEYCGSARSADQVEVEGTWVKLEDLIPKTTLSAIVRTLKLLYIAQLPSTKASSTKSLNLYVLAEGPLSATDAKEITQILVARLHLAPYETTVIMSNHPWFLMDEYFPLRDPLMPSLPIAKGDAVNNKIISCLSIADRLSCTGRTGGPAIDLTGQ